MICTCLHTFFKGEAIFFILLDYSTCTAGLTNKLIHTELGGERVWYTVNSTDKYFYSRPGFKLAVSPTQSPNTAVGSANSSWHSIILNPDSSVKLHINKDSLNQDYFLLNQNCKKVFLMSTFFNNAPFRLMWISRKIIWKYNFCFTIILHLSQISVHWNQKW